MTDANTIVNKLWRTCHVLRGDGRCEKDSVGAAEVLARTNPERGASPAPKKTRCGKKIAE